MENFKIIKALGEGSFGSALLVKDIHTKKNYVVKQVSLGNLSEKEKYEAMKEVEVLSQLQHPNIITYHKSFEENDNLYIVTDYCDGGDLYSKIRAQQGIPFTENQILDWFAQICLAVKHVHDRKILHRDIKTQNIFLMKSGIAKLGDFGIARTLNSTSELARTCIGTPYYLSPEICENKPYNNKSDIWSLGCVLCELITLKHAFEAKNMKNLVYKIINCSLPRVPDIYSQELKSLLYHIFNKNPQERPSIDAILKKPFILKHISKFLNETQINEQFSNANLFKNISLPKVKKQDENSNKIKITNPAAKYGISIARKKIKELKQTNKKSILGDNKNDVNNIKKIGSPCKLICHKNKADKNALDIVTVNKKQEQLLYDDSENKGLPNLNNLKQVEKQNFIKENINIEDPNNKSIIDINSIELCEKSNILKFYGKSNSKKALFEQEAKQMSPVSKDLPTKFERKLSRKNSWPFSIKSSNNDDLNLPLIFQQNISSCELVTNSNNNSNSKWRKSGTDILKNLPLEETASKMEATSKNDRVIVFKRRPHSAPHIKPKDINNKLYGNLNVNFTPNLYPILDVSETSLNSCLSNINKMHYNQSINLDFSKTFYNEIDAICHDDDIIIPPIPKGNLKANHELAKEISKDHYNNCISEKERININSDKTFIKYNYNSNICTNNAISDRVSPEQDISLPAIINDIPLSYKTRVIHKDEVVVESKNVQLPNLLESKNDTSCNEDVLTKNAIISNKIFINNTDSYENLHETLREDSSVASSSCSCKCSLSLNRSEIGIQCDMLGLSEKSSEKSDAFVDYNNEAKKSNKSLHHVYVASLSAASSFDNFYEFSYEKPRYLHTFNSLPDLSCIDKKSENTKLHHSLLFHKSIRENMSSLETNEIVESDDDDGSHYQTATSFEIDDSLDDLHRVCESMKYVLDHSQMQERMSICSSWSADINSDDIYNYLEQLREELEKKLGLETFLTAYRKLLHIFENNVENVTEGMKDVLNILNPNHEHLANEILELVVREHIYINDEHNQEFTLNNMQNNL